MSLFHTIGRFARSVDHVVRWFEGMYTPAPPMAFGERVRWYQARPRAFTYRRAVELFRLAEPVYRWRNSATNVRERRRHLQKTVGDRYILRCLREAATIKAMTVRVSAPDRRSLSEAIGEAFNERESTILDVLRKRDRI